MRYPNREELARMGLAAFLLYLGIYYWDTISQMLVLLLTAISPVVIGCAIAYIANIPMCFFERRLSRLGDGPVMTRARRPISLLAGIVIVLVFAGVLVRFIAPELVQSMRMMSYKVPAVVEKIRLVFREMDLETLVDQELDQFGDWQSIQLQLSNYLMSGAGGVMGSVVSRMSSVISSTFELFLSVVLAIYILMGKERLGAQVGMLVETYLGSVAHQRMVYVLGVLDNSFHSFIVGRCLVSVLLGVMCLGGMLLFRFPYAMTISTVVGVTYIVPVVGGFLGAIIGGLLIFSISPMKALLFILFLLVLEQFEANVIFPQVVGSTTGLPGIWVLAAVAVGGGLGGVPCILLSVPVVASVYQLVSDDLHSRREGTSVAGPAVEANPESSEEASR